jgi:energy-coupling factor transporter ATP-binding protein EcfA2
MGKEPAYRIYFAWTASSVRSSSEPTIVFSPTSDKWNDFTHKTNFKCKLLNAPSAPRFSTDVYLAFLSTKDTSVDHVRNLLRKSSKMESSALPAFYTMQLNLEAYRQVVTKLGSKEALEFLVAINDLVALKMKKPPKWFETAVTSKPFTLSFMRSSQTFFAFHNAAYILRGKEQKVESGVSRRLKLRFKLPSFENAHELDLCFEHESKASKRIVIIIGKNGVGKSQALSNLAGSLIRDDERLRTDNEKRPSINRLIAISSPGETRATFPTPRTTNRIPYRRIILGNIQSPRTQAGLGDVLVQLARSGERVRQQERWDLFCDTVSSVIKLDQVFVQVRQPPHDVPSTDLLELSPIPLASFRPHSEQRRLELWGSVDPRADLCRFIDGKEFPLSSGESTFIRFAAQACLYIENGTLLLFDEPETHLHPNLLTQFVGLLDALLKTTSSFAVLATHSAYFVREVPRSQVLILKEPVQRRIEVVTPRLKTLGADIGAISFFVFGDELYGRLLRELGKRLSRSSKEPDVLLEPLEDELSDEAIMFLRREL